MALVTDLAEDAVTEWLNGVACRNLFTAPRRPCSSGQTGSVVGTLKFSINSIAAINYIYNPQKFRSHLSTKNQNTRPDL